jgi:catechol 2,3-dioxygenase-like lactoylglutathione lyase family enzyme
MTKARVNDLRYVGLAVPDFEAERRFLVDQWGLVEVANEGDLAYFAAVGSPENYIVRLRKAEDRRAEIVGWSAPDRAAVDGLAAQITAAGGKLISQPAPLTSPGGGYGFRFFDPDGRATEISSDVEARPYRALTKGESIPERISHVVLHSPELNNLVAFYQDVLGFKVSDWLGDRFCMMRCNRFHHRLGMSHGPASLNHIAFDMANIDEMMRGFARLRKEGAKLSWGPGRHTAGNNAFSYFFTPGGNRLEYTAELEEVDDETWVPNVYPSSPEIIDQWGTGAMTGDIVRGEHEPERGLWQAPPV